MAYSEMIIPLDSSEPARQGGTLVKAPHRGSRLGLAVKHAVIDLLERERPDVPATLTENALENHHMVAINDLLGYRPVEYFGEFQKQI